jgi:DNA repair protein RadD
MTLREYQIEPVRKASDALRSGSVLLVAPTGAGKTQMAASIAASNFRKPLLVAHRREIVAQASMRGIPALSLHAALRRLRTSWKPDLLIIDEAHRATAPTYREIRSLYSGPVLGLTATPERTDGEGLGDIFDTLIEGPSTAELIKEGFLAPYVAFEAPDEALAQLKHMRREYGDFAQRHLGKLMSEPRLVGNVVREYRQKAAGRPALVFAVNRDHSRGLEEAFIEAGYRARHIDGNTSPRIRETELSLLAAGKSDVLLNVNLFTEGWDCPAVACIIMARPTASKILYLQSIGRGLRAAPGKENVIILDHAGNIERHGPPDAPTDWSLEGRKAREAREASQEATERQLDRLRALGFESLEEYELAEKRMREESMSPPEAAAALGISAGGLSAFLRRGNVQPCNGKKTNLVRYRKADILAVRDRFRPVGSVTAKEAAEILGKGVAITWVTKILRDNGVRPIGGQRSHARYDVEAVRALSRRISPAGTISCEEACALLGVTKKSLSWVLGTAGIKKAVGSSASTRYGEHEILALVRQRNEPHVISASEARKIMGLSQTHFRRVLKASGVQFKGAGARVRYNEREIRALKNKFNSLPEKRPRGKREGTRVASAARAAVGSAS